MDRRQFLRGVVATGVVAVGASAVAPAIANAAPVARSAPAGSAEAFLLSTARRALA